MKYKVIKTFYTIDGIEIVEGRTFNEGENGVKRKEIKYKDILLKEGYIEEVKEKKNIRDLKIGDKVVFDKHWYTKKEKKWLLYTTITMIDLFDNEIKYYYPNGQLFIEGLRKPTQEELDLYFN